MRALHSCDGRIAKSRSPTRFRSGQTVLIWCVSHLPGGASILPASKTLGAAFRGDPYDLTSIIACWTDRNQRIYPGMVDSSVIEPGLLKEGLDVQDSI